MKKILITCMFPLLLNSNAFAEGVNSNISSSTSQEAITEDNLAAKISFSDAWIRLPTPTSKNTAAYFKLHNETNIDLKMISAEAKDIAARTEIHDTKADANGVMKMYSLDSITIPAGQTLEFKPHSNHIMLMSLITQLQEGKEYDIKVKIVPADQAKYPNIELNYLIQKIAVKSSNKVK